MDRKISIPIPLAGSRMILLEVIQVGKSLEVKLDDKVLLSIDEKEEGEDKK